MAAQKLKGNCYICGAELGKIAMKNHMLKVHNEGREECWLVKIEGAHNKNYWLYIDVPVKATLSIIDMFMRDIWLECCGHLSAFTGPGYSEISMDCKLNHFDEGDQLLHEYDFGSTTECLVTFVTKINRQPQKEPVRLLARNIPPKFQCANCGAEAKYICTECMYESPNPFYCEACAEKHEHEDMLLPVTNSPRMGECAYCGDTDVYGFVAPGKEKT